MKYIKLFEFGPTSSNSLSNTLYSNDEFRIIGERDGPKKYRSSIQSSYAIYAIAGLIGHNSRYLNSKKLRKLKISVGDIYQIEDQLRLTEEKIFNIEKYRSSFINEFCSYNRKIYENIPGKIYMDITFTFYPSLYHNQRTYKEYLSFRI